MAWKPISSVAPLYDTALYVRRRQNGKAIRVLIASIGILRGMSAAHFGRETTSVPSNMPCPVQILSKPATRYALRRRVRCPLCADRCAHPAVTESHAHLLLGPTMVSVS